MNEVKYLELPDFRWRYAMEIALRKWLDEMEAIYPNAPDGSTVGMVRKMYNDVMDMRARSGTKKTGGII